MYISAVIITLNEAKHIARCIASLTGLVDEVVVVDTGSTDDTVRICEELEVRVVSMDWRGYAATKNAANALAQGTYILSIDADEVLSPELTASIQKVKEEKDVKGAYSFARLNHYCGKWIRHSGWYPDKKVRLFPKEKASWEGAHVHETLVLDDDLSVTHISGDLLHYTCDTVGEHILRIHRYAQLGAERMQESGKQYSTWKHILAPLLTFIKLYLFKAGFRDGYQGYLIARISAQEVFLRYAMLRELRMDNVHRENSKISSHNG